MKAITIKIWSKSLALLLVCVMALAGCHEKTQDTTDKYEVSLSLFDLGIHGENTDDVIGKLIEQTDEFDYYDDEKAEIKRLIFCGVPFGLNLDTEQTDGTTIITNIVLITSHQSKTDFETIKDGISKKYGNPDFEEYEEGKDEIGGKIYGRCRWYNGVTLRNVHSEEGGLILFM